MKTIYDKNRFGITDNSEYGNKVANENEQYKRISNIHANALPCIFTYWATKYLSPKLIEVFSANSVEYFYINTIMQSNKSDESVKERK